MKGQRKCGTYTHNGTLFSPKKWSLCHLWHGDHCVKWNKLDPETQVLFDPTHIYNLKNADLIENESWYSGYQRPEIIGHERMGRD